MVMSVVTMVISVMAMVMSVMTMVMSVVAMVMSIMHIWTCLHFGGVLKQAADVGEDGQGNDGGKPDQ